MGDDEVNVVHPGEESPAVWRDRRDQLVQFLVRRRREMAEFVKCDTARSAFIAGEGVNFNAVPVLGERDRLLFDHSRNAAGVGVGGATDRDGVKAPRDSFDKIDN